MCDPRDVGTLTRRLSVPGPRPLRPAGLGLDSRPHSLTLCPACSEFPRSHLLTLIFIPLPRWPPAPGVMAASSLTGQLVSIPHLVQATRPTSSLSSPRELHPHSGRQHLTVLLTVSNVTGVRGWKLGIISFKLIFPFRIFFFFFHSYCTSWHNCRHLVNPEKTRNL